MRIAGKWLTFFIGIPLICAFLSMICTYVAIVTGEMWIILIALIAATVLGIFGIVSLVLRNDLIKLDAYNGLLVQYVDGTGRISIVPAYLKGNEVYTKDSDFPICVFDREKYVFSFVGSGEGVVPADALFKIAGKPMIIVDRTTMVPLKKSTLTRGESEYQSLYAVRNIAAVVKNLSGRISGLEAAVAQQMTAGMRGFLGRWGMYIALIIIAIGIAVAMILAITQNGPGFVPTPGSDIILPR